ncbi:hypothetical protein M430DRAFT_201116 [Amorphotheca resinae ATCC 22711]|jgi:hypothetical protein|uniref:Uncharacterized protein n=1 Tax=Amorphotheca resinae ATCC 22711 TaxID=857342 RepID=A0A2T3BAP8_AMORE|nr:hypothetical protein M430DRAFT_201116 [Amorphotheca resinae ATCC 22711]PSS25349.1 hypothetical protein M430DRAFT_201116 [Amorphotheca resinae ATCC 22711]
MQNQPKILVQLVSQVLWHWYVDYDRYIYTPQSVEPFLFLPSIYLQKTPNILEPHAVRLLHSIHSFKATLYRVASRAWPYHSIYKIYEYLTDAQLRLRISFYSMIL